MIGIGQHLRQRRPNRGGQTMARRQSYIQEAQVYHNRLWAQLMQRAAPRRFVIKAGTLAALGGMGGLNALMAGGGGGGGRGAGGGGAPPVRPPPPPTRERKRGGPLRGGGPPCVGAGVGRVLEAPSLQLL